jgi:hypothetical protein
MQHMVDGSTKAATGACPAAPLFAGVDCSSEEGLDDCPNSIYCCNQLRAEGSRQFHSEHRHSRQLLAGGLLCYAADNCPHLHWE